MRSGESVLKRCGLGLFMIGTRSRFLGGIPSSSVLKVPFSKERIVFSHASLVL